MAEIHYKIARPINGISINGNEYLLNSKDQIMIFKTREECLEYVTKNITDKNPEDYVWEEEMHYGE